MPRKIDTLTEAMFLVSTDGIPGDIGYWTMLSGLEEVAEQSDTYSDGETLKTYTLPGQRSVSDIELEKPYDVVRDPALLQWWDTWCESSSDPISVVMQPVAYCYNQPEPRGEPFTLLGCRPIKLVPPIANKTSSTIAKIILGLTVDRIDYPG